MSGNAGSAGAGGGGADRPRRVLLYSFSTLDIPSVPAQLALYRQKLESLEFEVDESVDPGVFTDENLENYAAVGMINTCFSPFGQNTSGSGPEAEALRKLVQDGGGLFGTHCADVAFQGQNPPALYSELIGGRASSQYFDGTSSCRKVAEHPTVMALPETFEYEGNLDATDFIADDTIVLVTCDWGNGSGNDVPVSWVRSEGLGRVFFTGFAKVDGDITHETIGDDHILEGLAWVLGT
jgi:type 1 glutamine amidotransferase